MDHYHFLVGMALSAKNNSNNCNKRRTLQFWNEFCGVPVKKKEKKNVTVAMHENIHVSCTLESTDSIQSSFGVSELATPLGIYPFALLRQQDIQHIEIPLETKDIQSLLSHYYNKHESTTTSPL